MPNQPDTLRYRIFKASRDDMNEGWVWVWPKGKELEKKIEGRRRLVKIEKSIREAGDAKKSEPVYCEALYADDLFRGRYRRYCEENAMERETGGCQASEVTENNSKSENAEPEIYIGAWYRYLLGMLELPKTDPHRSLKITIPKNSWQALYWQFLACVNHPQIVVALGTVLGLIVTGSGCSAGAAQTGQGRSDLSAVGAEVRRQQMNIIALIDTRPELPGRRLRIYPTTSPTDCVRM